MITFDFSFSLTENPSQHLDDDNADNDDSFVTLYNFAVSYFSPREKNEHK